MECQCQEGKGTGGDKMTVKELKDILATEENETEVTMCININDGDAVLWRKLNSSWHTDGGELVLGE